MNNEKVLWHLSGSYFYELQTQLQITVKQILIHSQLQLIILLTYYAWRW